MGYLKITEINGMKEKKIKTKIIVTKRVFAEKMKIGNLKK